MKNRKLLTNDELEKIKTRIYNIKNEFEQLNSEYKKQKKSYDTYYFKKSRLLGNELKTLQKKLKQGLKANKKLEGSMKKCY